MKLILKLNFLKLRNIMFISFNYRPRLLFDLYLHNIIINYCFDMVCRVGITKKFLAASEYPINHEHCKLFFAK